MNGKYLLPLLGCLLIGCAQNSPQHYLEQTSILEDQGKLKEAIALWGHAIEKYPYYVPAFLNRGADRSALGDAKGAIEDYNKALNLDPRNTLALLNRGKNEARLEQYQLALDDFHKAIEFTDSSALDRKPGLRLVTNEDLDKEAFISEIVLERGYVYYDIDSLRWAFHDVQYCIEQKAELGLAYRLRGLIYISTGNKDQGCKDLSWAVAQGDDLAKELSLKYCR